MNELGQQHVHVKRIAHLRHLSAKIHLKLPRIKNNVSIEFTKYK